MRIMLIDDDPACVEISRAALQHEYPDVVIDHQVRYSGLPVKPAYDAVIIDIDMPHFDVIECLRELRRSSLCVPIVVMTHAWSEGMRVACLKAGADDYAAKGTLSRTLGFIVASAIEKRRVNAEQRVIRAMNKQDTENRVAKLNGIRTRLDTMRSY